MNQGTYQGLLSTPGKRLVLFYGTACAPCARLKPRLEPLAIRAGIALHQINAATEMEAVRALGIRGVPSLVGIKDGVAEVLFTGDLADDAILRKLEEKGLVS